MKSELGIMLVWMLVCAWAPTVNAITQDITAIYRPDPTKPQDNKFVNTTPVSGYCFDFPDDCRINEMFSLSLPLRFDSRAAIKPGHGLRQGAMLKVPSGWRRLDVVDQVTGERVTVEVRISGIGAGYKFDRSIMQLVDDPIEPYLAFQKLWGGSSWSSSAPSPCKMDNYVGYIRDDGFGETFFWGVPVGAVCAKQAKYSIPVLMYDELTYTYELRTPNPLSMKSGQYTGSLTYSIGPGADFDMGDIMYPSDGALTLNFNLDVEHILKVDIPPGGNRVELLPEGGWQPWLQTGRVPKKLFRDQTFHIWTSSSFTMHLICGRNNGNGCSVRNAGNHAVPLRVQVSLPNGLTNSSGKPVIRQTLDNVIKHKFQPGFYIDRQPAVLHFEIAQLVDEMLHEHRGSTYTGTVTVVWDSEL